MDPLQSIPLPVLLPVIMIDLILMIVALVDLIRVAKTRGPKWIWFIVVIVFSTFGPIIYFVAGRKPYK